MDLHIALQDGFADDTVAIAVNGRDVFAKSGVSTNRVIGRADSIDTTVDGPTAEVRVEVRSKNAAGTLSVTLANTPFVAVSVQGNIVTLTPSNKPFRYM